MRTGCIPIHHDTPPRTPTPRIRSSVHGRPATVQWMVHSHLGPMHNVVPRFPNTLTRLLHRLLHIKTRPVQLLRRLSMALFISHICLSVRRNPSTKLRQSLRLPRPPLSHHPTTRTHPHRILDTLPLPNTSLLHTHTLICRAGRSQTGPSSPSQAYPHFAWIL
jgi:hypothetical protein